MQPIQCLYIKCGTTLRSIQIAFLTPIVMVVAHWIEYVGGTDLKMKPLKAKVKTQNQP